MLLAELYEHYNKNWVLTARELGFGSNTIYLWRKQGYVSIKSQMVIEKRTNGLFKANLEHAAV